MDTMEASALYDLADHMVRPGLFLPYEASRFVENTMIITDCGCVLYKYGGARLIESIFLATPNLETGVKD